MKTHEKRIQTFFFCKTQDDHGIINPLLAQQLFENIETINWSELFLLDALPWKKHFLKNLREIFLNKGCRNATHFTIRKKNVMVREEDSNFECLNCDAEVRFQVDLYKINIFKEIEIL